MATSRRETLAMLFGLAVSGCGSGTSNEQTANTIAVMSAAPPSPSATIAMTPAPFPMPTPDADASPAGAGSLDARARARRRRFRSAVSYNPVGAESGSFTVPEYAGLLERECGPLVLENELKWQAIAPARFMIRVRRLLSDGARRPAADAF